MDLGLRGKTALVLGSTSGLGRAVAEVLANEGARVGFVGRRGDIAMDLAARHVGAAGFRCDLADADSAERLVADVADKLGTVDILVLNSGGPAPGGAVGLSAEGVSRAFETLVVRQIQFVELLLPRMRERRWGRIVAVGSTSVQEPIHDLALSNIARSGLAGYLKTLSREVASDGVTVNMVLPGRIATDRLGALDSRRAISAGIDVEAVTARSRSDIPIGRYGLPEEFATVVAFLCSTKASYVTGEQVRCDGGLVAGY